MASADIHYRVATPADAEDILALMVELVEELGPSETSARVLPRLAPDIAAALASPQVRIFLAEADGGSIGLCRGDVLTADPIFRLRDDPRCGYVDQMFVRRAQRGRGVGGTLMRQCEQWFRSQGIAHCLLHAAPRAVHFYARTGYQPNREMFKRLF